MNGRRSWRLGVLALALAALCPAGARAGEPVTLALQWQHQAQFAGYYAALEQGLYAAAGLDVTIQRGGPDIDSAELLRSGKADFATFMLCTALGHRAAGLPVVHLAQVVNRSNFLLVAWRHPEGGGEVTELADLDGRRVTVWEDAFRAPFEALFERHGVRPVVLPQYNTFSLFLHRGVDAYSAMRYNEYHTLLQSGVSAAEVTTFSLSENGVTMPEDGVYCLRETWERRPEQCRAFAEASLEGWRWAREHPEEALELVMSYINLDQLPTNRTHMRWMLREMLASVFPGEGDGWEAGALTRADYAAAVDTLESYAGLPSAPAYEDFVAGEVSNGRP